MPQRNIDTPEGMAEAVAEQTAMIAQLAQGGRWVVPRSGSIYMLDQEGKRAKLAHGGPEPKVTRVFEAMGWTVVPEDGEPEDALETVRANHQFVLF